MKTIGLARLGRDAEVRYLQNGDAVCNLSLAVNYGQKGQDGNRPTQWIDATLWGKRAESLAPFLTKGSVHCFTLDEIHIETYQGRNGEGHKMAARVLDVELGPRAGGESGAQQQRPQGQPTGQQRPQGQGNQQQRPQQPAPQPAADFDSFDDDIPF